MKSPIRTAAFALAAALVLGACSGAKEQTMNDSAAGQSSGTGTNDARGPNTTDTSAARGGVDSSAAATTGTATDTTRRDTSRAGSRTPRTTP